MKSVQSGDKCVLCDIPVDLYQAGCLDKNREVLLVKCHQIYQLVGERRMVK